MKILRIEIRNDSVLLDGYVNAVARDSRSMLDENGEKFVEQITPKTFQKAVEKSDDILCLLNHDPSRVLGSTKKEISNFLKIISGFGQFARLRTAR